MIFKKIWLDIPTKTIKSLKESFGRVISFLEKGGTLNLQVLEEVQQGLSAVIAGNKQIRELLERAAKGSDFFHLNLCHQDAEVLNLPWGIALDPVSGRFLSEVPQVFISKNVLTKDKEPHLTKPAGGPLKILVMISSPKDVALEERLYYEEEERQILRAFEPLFQAGEVQVDFTDDGSLEALRRKVELNDYHILHFSGHGDFDEEKGEGFLLLEDPVSLKSETASAFSFAEALLKPGHTIPLVVLSSCRTAKARFERGAAGITGTLMQKGIPAVVSMGLSIRDRYATFFAAHFYGQVARKKTIIEAFAEACRFTRDLEAKDIREAHQNMVPLQWLIPHLYLSGALRIVDWEKPFERLKPEGTVILFANTTMEKSGQTSEQFVGRREDLAVILPKLYKKKPIMLKGQGGIGKTTLARKLVQRLQASKPALVPFIYNEEGKEFSLPAVLGQLKRFCAVKDKTDWLDSLKYLEDNMVSHITFLFTKISEAYPLVLLFDNVESFLDEKSGAFAVEHEATLHIIWDAVLNPQIHTLVTGRYPLKELAEELEPIDLNDIDLSDFIRKCYNLGLTGLSQGQMEFLYKSLGGNFRMLEFFHRAFTRDPGNINRVFAGLEAFREQAKKYTEAALQEMAENLIFDNLWQKSGADEQKPAKELACFELPVIDVVFRMMGYDPVPLESLGRLQDLTLIQVYLDREAGLVYYFMPVLVKKLLERRGWLEEMPKQFHEQAGRYHYYMYREVRRGSTSELDAAFWQFYRAGNRERISELGEGLAGFYYDHAFYAEALKVCRVVEELWGDQLPWWCCNRIGMIVWSTGSYDLALDYYKRGMKILESTAHPTDEDLENKGVTLNNISQIYQARGDLDTALRYLEQSLKISEQIGDKSGEGKTLNNISQIYDARGDLDTALRYLEQSLKISEQIGDKAGEGKRLNNISQIYQARGDYDTALRYLEQSLKISEQIGDKYNQGVTLNNISQIYDARGDYDTALRYLEQSLKIREQIGDKSGEGVTLTNIGTIYYARGDYDTALRYLEQSLKISRQIGDIAGEAIQCFNMAQIFEQTGEIEKAIPLVERTVEIDQITQHPDLESDMRYLMELRRKVSEVSEVSEVSRVSGDKKEGS
jgi:tetratricopeptide (TPR) repeat protein